MSDVPGERSAERLGPRVPAMAHSPKQRIAADGMILRALIGSEIHGTSLAGQGDRDEMGVCIEPPETVAGLSRFEHYTFRTQPDGARSGPGDLDLVVYGLRKFAGLAAHGNPTVLLLLFVADEHICFADELGRELRANRHLFLSRQAGPRFRGYLESQRRGLMGLRSGGTRNQGRADIRERYGFDCYLDDTEFLTRRGWRTYDEITDGEAVATVDTGSGRVEFQVPTERVVKPYDGPIHFVRHRYTECAVTPNHRMWTSPVEPSEWAFRPMADLRGTHGVRVAGTRSAAEYPVSDATLALVGWSLAHESAVQPSRAGVPAIRTAEERLPGWALELSGRQADVLLGALGVTGGPQVHRTTSGRRAGEVQALALLAGRRSTVRGPGADGVHQVSVRAAGEPFEAVSISEDVEVEDVVGRRIVCFTVPNETLVTRRNGRVAMHGNTKFAMHMVRLGIQGVELMRTGAITLPIPEPDLTWLRELRRGEHTKEEALDWAAELEEEIERAMAGSPLPERPDHAALDRWLVDLHRRHWGWGAGGG
jgi:hypothetical protein